MIFGNPLGYSVNINNANLAVSGNVNATITNASIPVTGNVNANITNASIAVTGTLNANITNASLTINGTVSLTAGTSINVANTVTITPSGTINVQGVAGGTAIGIAGAVTISAGTVDIGTVTGPVNVENVVNTALATQYYTDVLGSGVTSWTGSNPYSHSFASVARPYKAIIVQGLSSIAPLCCVITNGTIKTCAAFHSLPESSGATSFFQAIVPCFNNTGDTIKVTIYYAATNASFNFSVYGTTEGAIPEMRPDGRCYPIGRFAATNFTLSGTAATVIAAPAGALRILLKSISFGGNNTGNPAVAATVNGSSASLLSALIATVPTVSQDWGDGLLCDQGTAVVLSAGANTAMYATALYDLVV